MSYIKQTCIDCDYFWQRDDNNGYCNKHRDDAKVYDDACRYFKPRNGTISK